MKKLAALLLAVALFSPALAQKTTFQGIHPKPKPTLVAPATKPTLLHTGKPITPDQVNQLLVTTIQGYQAGNSTPKKFVKSNNAGPTVLNLDMMYRDGVGFATANQPGIVAFGAGLMVFQPGEAHNLIIYLDVVPNTAYVLVMRVFLQNDSINPQLTFSPDSTSIPPQTIAGTPGVAEEIAYSFVSSRTGQIGISISSPNAIWMFGSCQISSLPIN